MLHVEIGQWVVREWIIFKSKFKLMNDWTSFLKYWKLKFICIEDIRNITINLDKCVLKKILILLGIMVYVLLKSTDSCTLRTIIWKPKLLPDPVLHELSSYNYTPLSICSIQKSFFWGQVVYCKSSVVFIGNTTLWYPFSCVDVHM